MSKQHCRMLQCRMLLRHCCRFWQQYRSNVRLCCQKRQHCRSNRQQSCLVLRQCCFDIVASVDRALVVILCERDLIAWALRVRWEVVVCVECSADWADGLDDGVLVQHQVNDVVVVVDDDDSAHDEHVVRQSVDALRSSVAILPADAATSTAQRRRARLLEDARRAPVADWRAVDVVHRVEVVRVGWTVDGRVQLIGTWSKQMDGMERGRVSGGRRPSTVECQQLLYTESYCTEWSKAAAS